MRPDLTSGATTKLGGWLKLAVGELLAAVLLRPIFFLCLRPRCRPRCRAEVGNILASVIGWGCAQ